MEIIQLFKDLPTLETDRLILRKFLHGDVASVYEFSSDPEVTKFLTWNYHKAENEAKLFIDIVLNNYKNGQPAPWAIVQKETGKLIGSIGLVEMNTFFNRAEIGFLLNRKFWRKGYSTEAIFKIIDFCFTQMDLHRIEALCEIPNITSANLLAKVGMKFEGILKGYGVNNNQPVDMKIFSIVKTEWTHQ